MSRINLHQMAASGCLAAIRPDSRGSPWILKREGGSHSLWTNPVSGAVEAVPRHTEIPNVLARKICRNLGIPEPGSS
ncbi:MAG: type II toxin-antitoxin system HicA family toxin [Vicinamibacterales bacterium]